METADKILQAARDIYLERGMAGLSMRAVASRVGLSATAIYRHYADKDALILAVVEEGFRLFGSYLQQALEKDSAAERLRCAGDRYVDFALEHPAYYKLIFVATAFWDRPELPEHARQRSRRTFVFLIDRVREFAVDQSLAQDRDPEDLARSIWAMSHGLVSLFLAGRLDCDAQAFRAMHRTAFGHLFGGLWR